MAAATTSMARGLGPAVTAEGAEVRDHLAGLGGELAQGWLYSAAVPGPSVADVLRRLGAAGSASRRTA